jgi:hypothetical protein
MNNPHNEQDLKFNREEYNKEYKLPHVVISDVWYFDDNDKCCPAKLELFGYGYEIDTYKNGEPYQRHQAIQRTRPFKLSYWILESDGLNVTLDGHCGKLRLSMANFKILKAYFDEKNAVYIQEEEACKDEILSILPKLYEDSELVQMASNFIEEVPTVFYIDPKFIISTECLISSTVGSRKIGDSLFLSDEFKRSSVSKIELDKVDIPGGEKEVLVTVHVKNAEIIKSYLDNSFFLLVKLIKDRLNLTDNDQAIYLTYVFLCKVVIRHFSQKWAREYNKYFGNIDDLSLSEAVQQYFLIETIDPNNLQTAGTFIYYLIDHGKFGSDNYLLCLNIFVQQLNPLLEKQKIESFARKIQKSSVNRAYTINDIDLMSGKEFEQFIAVLFSKMGYETEVTKSSGDQGIDVIASKGGDKIGIQAKCYSGTVGNSAIQETVAGRNYYHLDKAIVVTNAGFTNSAKELAEANSVVLWNRTILKDKITELW